MNVLRVQFKTVLPLYFSFGNVVQIYVFLLPGRNVHIPDIRLVHCSIFCLSNCYFGMHSCCLDLWYVTFQLNRLVKQEFFAGLFSVECSKSKDVETERENQFYYKIYVIFDGDMIETMSRFFSLICYNLISGGSSMSQTRGRQLQMLGRQPIITGRNEVVAKVMFLQLCVILFTGEGVSAKEMLYSAGFYSCTLLTK